MYLFFYLLLGTKKRKPFPVLRFSDKAEREGFEPPDLWQSTVFKTAALDRSAISPAQKYILSYNDPKNIKKNIWFNGCFGRMS